MEEKELFTYNNEQIKSDVKPEEGLFQDYEVNKIRLTPYVYKFIGASLLVNAVFALTLSQVDLFQQKACDSAYIGKVCQVIDAAYIGSMFYGTERTTVDEPYDKTEFDTADITWVNVDDRFQYPDGFFYQEPTEDDLALVNSSSENLAGANPSSAFMTPGNPFGTSPSNPTTTTTPSTGLDLNKPANLPKANPNAVSGKMPDSPFTIGGDPTTSPNIKVKKYPLPKISTPKNSDLAIINKSKGKTTSNESPTSLPTLEGENAGNKTKPEDKNNQPTSDKTAKKSNKVKIEINRTPLTKFGLEAKKVLSDTNADPSQDFAVSMKGFLNDSGKLDDKKSKWGNPPIGNEKLVNLVKDGITALNDSGYLQYLTNLQTKELDFFAEQKNGKVTAKVVASVGTDLRARILTSGFKSIISWGISDKKEDLTIELNEERKQNGLDELFLLEKATVTSEGNKIIITFELPTDVAKGFIQKKLSQIKDDAETSKPQSSSLEPKQTGQNIAK